MTLGVVLAGGRGRRMASTIPKPLIPLAGQSLVLHVIGRIRPQVSRIAISANDPEAFRTLGYRVVRDRREGFAGPAEGLTSAWLACGGDHPVLCVPGDTPFLPRDLCARLAAALPPGGVAVAGFRGRWQSVCALWSPRALAALAADDGAPDRRTPPLRETIARFAHELVEFDDDPGAPGGDPFFNVNTPDDLTAAEGGRVDRF